MSILNMALLSIILAVVQVQTQLELCTSRIKTSIVPGFRLIPKCTTVQHGQLAPESGIDATTVDGHMFYLTSLHPRLVEKAFFGPDSEYRLPSCLYVRRELEEQRLSHARALPCLRIPLRSMVGFFILFMI